MFKRILFVAIAGLSLGISSANAQNYYDPLEKYNRHTFAFNSVVDYYALEPIAKGYRFIVPAYGRARVDNFLDNLFEPLNAINSLLQGDIKQTGDSIARFALNSTFGLFGLYDLAAKEGIVEQEEDFGQTLAVWGVPAGPYLVLPIMGPSTVRDTVGRAIDGIVLDPIDHFTDRHGYEREQWIVRGLKVVSFREKNIENVETLRRTKDPYAALRSAYIQARQNAINNGGNNPQLDRDFADAFAQ